MRLTEMPGSLRQVAFLAGFIVLCLAAGGAGAILTAPAIPSWYASIFKPSWTPPNWVFGPVWTTLYVMMAVAGWLVWRSKDAPRRRPALVVWAVQLALNALWPPLFFGVHAIGIALIDIYLLWLFIGRFLITSWPLSRPAAILFLPYWAWVSFASALNLAIWIMNGAVRN
jgi:translocator protein